MPTFFEAVGDALRADVRPAASSTRVVDERPSIPRQRVGWMGHMMAMAMAASSAGTVDLTGAHQTGGGLQPAPGFALVGKKSRRTYLREDLRRLGAEAWKFKENAPKNERSWQVQFLISRYGALDPKSFTARQLELRAALKAIGPNELVAHRNTAAPSLTRNAPGTVNPTGRPRRVENRNRKDKYHERTGLCAELEDELWRWFVDRVAHNKTRVWAAEITRQAVSYKQAIMEDWKTRCDSGMADPNKKPRLPDVESPKFLRRWRYRYNITARTVNLRYKIPRATFLARLQTFWSNCIIVRRLYEVLYPGHKLDFIGFDQKPLWFNSIMAERTYAFNGQAKVSVAENVSASRARFTAMTQCKTWLDPLVDGLQPAPDDEGVSWDVPLAAHGDQEDECVQSGDLMHQMNDFFGEDATGVSGLQPEAPEEPDSALQPGATQAQVGLSPHIAILFKVGEATCSVDNLRASVEAGPRTLIQGSPSGSYKLHHVLEFLEWVLKPASELGKIVCVVLDWFAPHCHAHVDKLVHKLGHLVIRIGGGLTAVVQVEDTHAHRPYNNHYRNFEKDAATKAWDLRPGSLLESSRQAVLTRAEDAWKLVDHQKCVEGWCHDGITNPLDKPGSAYVGSQCQPLWEEIGMDGIRTQLMQDVDDAVASGDITSMAQYHELLLEYDDHAHIVEGMEGAPVYVYDESGAHLPMGDDGFAECADEAIGEDGFAECADGAIGDDAVMDAIDKEAMVLEDGFQPVPKTAIFASTCGNLESGLQPGPSASNSAGVYQVGGSSSSSAGSCAPPPSFDWDGLGGDDAEEDKDTTLLRARHKAAEILRACGDTTLAHYLEEQAARHARKSKKANPTLQKLLRETSEKKRLAMMEGRAGETAKRQRVAEKNLDLKIVTEQRLAASAGATAAKAVAKAADATTKAAKDILSASAKDKSITLKHAELNAKTAKEKEKKAQKAEEKNLDTLRRNFAGRLAREFVRFTRNRELGPARRAALLKHTKPFIGHVPWKKVGPLPHFWDPKDKRGLQNISPKPGETFGGFTDDVQPIWASEAFMWQLWCEKSPSGASQPQLRKFVESVMPGYNKIIGERYPIDDILKANAYNADVSFVIAAWCYSKCTPPDLLPCGLRQWPLPAT